MQIDPYHILNVRWRLASCNTDLAEKTARIFALFAENGSPPADCSPPDLDDALLFQVNAPGRGEVLTLPDAKTVNLLPSPWTFAHLHMEILNTIFNHIESHWLLHAAALSKNGMGIAICGPSGFGKTTLALALQQRGWDLLSDEFAAVERTTGRMDPFPRLPGCRTPKNNRWWSIADFSGGRKWYPPPTEAGYSKNHSSAPLKAVFLLHNRRRTTPAGAVAALRFGAGSRQFQSALNSLNAPAPNPVLQRGPMMYFIFSGQNLSAVYQAYHSTADGRLFLEKRLQSPLAEDWEQQPVVQPVSGNQPVLEGLSYLRNRGPNSRLMHHAGGRIGPILIEISRLFAHRNVFTLGIGRLEEMVERIESTVTR